MNLPLSDIDAKLAIDQEKLEFVSSFTKMCRSVHANAVDKGFWEAPRNTGEAIALMHSELSEALEIARKDGPKDKLTEELADCVIRIMDFCEGKDLPLAMAVWKKNEYNLTRPYKHGKAF